MSPAFCVWATSDALLFSAWQLVGMAENGKIWGHGGQTKAGEYLEYFAWAGHCLCLNVALAFANSASFQKGLIVAEWDFENFRSSKSPNEHDYGRVRNTTFGAQALSASGNSFLGRWLFNHLCKGFFLRSIWGTSALRRRHTFKNAIWIYWQITALGFKP